MKRSKILVIIISIFVLTLTGCGKAGGEKNQEYGGVIAGLGDDEQFALEDIGEKEDVLFTTDLTYDDGLGHSAALYSDVYYIMDGEVYNLGRIESMGTAYPISYGKKCIYTASEHSLEIYVIEFSGHQLVLKERYEAVFDETDQISYHLRKDGEERIIPEKDYLKVYEEYQQGTVVNFGYGASDRS